jgi:hypothetical protein
MTKSKKDGGRALRETRNRGLEKEQERLTDPEHHKPEEDEGGSPDREEQLEAGRKPAASKDRLKNPPQVTGPREKSNEMT